MLELPESRVLAQQIQQTLSGRRIASAQAAHSPHGFAWYFGDPADYAGLLEGAEIQSARGVGGMLEILLPGRRLLFGDGCNLRLIGPGAKRPAKHQLLLELDDGQALAVSVQMYGGIWAYPEGANDNPYYLLACQRPSPLEPAFTLEHFAGLMDTPKPLSAKALLATEQRIPGLGNGVLQDILWQARIHPKRKVDTLTDGEVEALYQSVRRTLGEMIARGGRDTEKDLFGRKGGYATIVSRNTVGMPCPRCGGDSIITKEAFLGGSVYVCTQCQR